MEYLILILRFFLAAVFVTAAVAKILDFAGAKRAMKDFGIPAGLGGTLSFALISTEFLVAFFLLFAQTGRYSAIAAAVLLSIFTLAIARLLIKGINADCHCFGQIQEAPVDKMSVYRNAGLIAVSILIFALYDIDPDFEPGFLLTSEIAVGAILGFAAWSLITAALILGLQSRNRLDAIEARMASLELTAAFIEKHDAAGDPNEGLPVGALVPEVFLKDLEGNEKSLRELVSEGPPVLAVLAGPGCVPCGALADKFEPWEKSLDKKARLVVISNGDAEANLNLFGENNRGRIYLQEKKTVAEALHAKWSPTGLLISANGRIASSIAAGDAGIESLMELVRETKFDDGPLFVGTSRENLPETFGKEIPDFKLPTAAGGVFRRDDFKSAVTLAVFWSLTCPHCTDILEYLLDWNSEANGLNLIVFADGPFGELQKTGLGERLVRDKGYKVSETLGMHGTPSAVIVDSNALVASELVAGAEKIAQLAGSSKV